MKRTKILILAIAVFCAFHAQGRHAFATTEEKKEIENFIGGNFALSDIPEYSGRPDTDINDGVPFFSEKEMTTDAYEYYNPLDEMGRCTYAMACVGPETMPTEERGDISEVKPTGWHAVRYEEIDQEFLYNRCHLLGFQLTGEDANSLNLITGTRYMNVEGMLPYENSVAEYVRGTGNHVIYRVTPIFKGEDLLCRGVVMEARSVEDPLVQFCVFCYNVQPGIEIDYRTGDSHRASEAGDENEERAYVLNKNTMKFHYPDCESAGKISKRNRKDVTAAREKLISEGYSPCGICHP